MYRTFHFLVVIIFLFSIIGCSSGGSDAVTPLEPSLANVTPGSHELWGLWQFSADPKAGTLDVVQLRTGDFHLNALPFLEPPPPGFLTIESVEWNGNIIDIDIGIRHPFFGLTQFTGFDVCGILITNGTMTGFNDSSIVMAGNSEDTYLMNPDGYSPWWNPTYFPPNSTNPIFGYVDGLLGVPDSNANYNSTVCGYKYFADDLGPEDTLDALDLDLRGLFSAGQKNTRHYTIHLGDGGLIFNYAVDANWKYPQGGPPWQTPGSFPINANRPEAFRISIIEAENSLYFIEGGNKGGTLGLDIVVYDWQGPDTIHSVGAEWPGLFSYQATTVPIETTEFTGTYHIELSGDNLASNDPVNVFITTNDNNTHPALGNIPGYWIVSGFEVSDEGPIVLEERIVFTAQIGEEDGPWELFSIDPEGLTEPVQWTHQTEDYLKCREPELSPDGRYIAYQRCWITGWLGYELRRIDVLTGEDIPLTGEIGEDFYFSPDWHPDGQTIVCEYLPSMFADSPWLVTMDADGSNEAALPPGKVEGCMPAYSPDGEYIYFTSPPGWQVSIYEVATCGITQYTSDTGYNWEADCSPDGTLLAWNHQNDEIHIGALSSSDPPDKTIILDPFCNSPSFNPDGTKIVFQYGYWQNSEIAVYDLTDDTWHNIPHDFYVVFEPAWGEMLIQK